ncbi:hypothetical protein ABGT23_02050 [Enterobacter cloacae]|uniref:hypothetical protein n=1 Tax=Enterobacter cloacae TaxID=550 RepID=UPI00345D9EC9
MRQSGHKLTAYTSIISTRLCQPVNESGRGRGDLIEKIPVNHKIDLQKLKDANKNVREAGFIPFLVIATVGTVDTGTIDNLTALTNIACKETVSCMLILLTVYWVCFQNISPHCCPELNVLIPSRSIFTNEVGSL